MLSSEDLRPLRWSKEASISFMDDAGIDARPDRFGGFACLPLPDVDASFGGDLLVECVANPGSYVAHALARAASRRPSLGRSKQ
jgi:hypothetical protein